jgi:alpha-D-xyloside xylohydrolase
VRTTDGAELVREQAAHFTGPGPRVFTANGDGYYRLEQRFAAYPGERIFGPASASTGGSTRKASCSIWSSATRRCRSRRRLQPRLRNPVEQPGRRTGGTRRQRHSMGRRLGAADRLLITTGDSPRDLLSQYADATGHAPTFPGGRPDCGSHACAYSQTELLEIAQDHARRDIPVSVIVIDYYHWTHLGDWKFDGEAWPDSTGMVKALSEIGMRVMVSVWPSVNPLSDNYDRMLGEGMLVGTETGVPFHHRFSDIGFHGKSLGVAFYDATDARALSSYGQASRQLCRARHRGLLADACEPEIYPEQHGNLVFAAGPGREVANLYPREHARGIFEHMRADGHEQIISLPGRPGLEPALRCRPVVGDIPTTSESLAAQVRAGLNVAVSGSRGGQPTSAASRGDPSSRSSAN